MVRLPVMPQQRFINNRKGRRSNKKELERHLDETLAGRSCGECRACCQVLAIAELEKPVDTMCPHAGPGPRCCTIYASRPTSCQEYLCHWKIGLGTPEQRPDRLGLVISPTRPGTLGYPGATVHELWPGALNENGAFLSQAGQRYVLILIQQGRPRAVIGPDHMIAGMQGEIEKIRQFNLAAKARL